MYDLNMENKMFLINAIQETNLDLCDESKGKEDKLVKQMSDIFASLQAMNSQIRQVKVLSEAS